MINFSSTKITLSNFVVILLISLLSLFFVFKFPSHDIFSKSFFMDILFCISFQLTFFSIFAFNKYTLKTLAFLVTSIYLVNIYTGSTYGIYLNFELIKSITEVNNNEISIVLHDYKIYILILALISFSFLIYQTKIIFINNKYMLKILTIPFSILIYIYTTNTNYFIASLYYLGNNIEPEHTLSNILIIAGNKYLYRDIDLDYSLFKNIEKIENENANIVLIIGESARAENFSINGYKKNTNPLIEKENNLISFKNASSCGTSTAFSIPCILARSGRLSGFSLPSKEPSIVHAFNKMGFDTYFLSMQDIKPNIEIYKSCKQANHCEFKIGKYDIEIRNRLSEIIKKSKNKFIVIQMKGSHFLYNENYPKEFNKFTPICTDMPYNCNNINSAINSYDNSILYTDYVLNRIYDALKSTNSFVLFSSDHGESIGENNYCGHGVVYKFAPKEQTNVPFIVWASDTFLDKHGMVKKLISENKYKNISHDNIFHTMIGCINPEAKLTDKKLNLCA
jgi:glucan phosphoethanolaminetransferase (alkaline phosphatase superfamily)